MSSTRTFFSFYETSSTPVNTLINNTITLAPRTRTEIGGAPDGLQALVIAAAAQSAPAGLIHVARDDARQAAVVQGLAFFAADLEVVSFPAWDCLPYDRVSPNPEIVSQRMNSLSRLAESGSSVVVVVTTVNAILQRVPPRAALVGASFRTAVGDTIALDDLTRFLAGNGYRRTGTVMEPGEVAVRGGIVDVFPPGAGEPVRLDLFGDVVEGIRSFDPLTQRTIRKIDGVELGAVGEVALEDEAIARFRAGYSALFGVAGDDDPLYAAVSAGRRHIGMEHWLPLFHETCETLFDYLPEATLTLDHLVDEAQAARFEAIADYYEARRLRRDVVGAGAAVYKPLPPDRLYLTPAEWERLVAPRAIGALSPYRAPADGHLAVDAGGRDGARFVSERLQPGASVFEAVRDHVRAMTAAGRRVVIASYSEGARDRLAKLLKDHGLETLANVESWAAVGRLPRGTAALAVLGLERGFEVDDLVVISEPDILGERLARPPSRRRRAENFIAAASELAEGDLVIHVEHGIGQFTGLKTLDVGDAPHDCLCLVYDGGDRLFIPVENIDVLSRYGSEDAGAALDRLGSTAWQTRKARVKKRLKDIAGQLIAIAAQRHMQPGDPLTPPDGLYDEFCARFPYFETDDQRRAVDEVLGDLATGHPMDRLICGDVGFGKTEVALRSAFIAALAGKQVAVVAPTTLLCRQHFHTFSERFAGLPVRIAQLSRLVSAREAAEVKKGLAAGDIDIVIGTHALLGKNVAFRDLGLLVVDEEQHFGVAHKERLKALRANVHVLTLTATPIPRTLQMALSGVRELSLITTPPADRLAIRTFIMPFDPVVVREAILREHYRGGQIFYICPRIADLPDAARFLKEEVPEVKVGVAHGRLAARQLDRVMNAFYDGGFEVLLCTTIVESGLDIPAANTMIVHRADMFGLAQLYQLRGRIGRSKTRAYAYLTLPPQQMPTAGAEKRLQVMQALDGLGAGFSLASHDLDIRGAGNLLGEEQSGHIREVGLELYQQMLEEAVTAARSAAGEAEAEAEETWSPQINLGTAVLIPETYVADLSVRMGLYRRLARLEARADIDAFGAELIDRFGPLPSEVEHLLAVVAIKQACRVAAVARVDAGPRGATLAFREDSFSDPAALVAYIGAHPETTKLRPDQRLVCMRDWDGVDERLAGVQGLLEELAGVRTQAGAAASPLLASGASSAIVSKS